MQIDLNVFQYTELIILNFIKFSCEYIQMLAPFFSPRTKKKKQTSKPKEKRNVGRVKTNWKFKHSHAKKKWQKNNYALVYTNFLIS